MARGWPPAAALLLALAGAPGASAQQAAPDAAPGPLYLPPRPAEAGKPLAWDRQLGGEAERDARAQCAPVLSCRVQLLGVIEKNGAVMLRGRAFAW